MKHLSRLDRPTLLDLLIYDFRRSQPDANRATVVELYARLLNFEDHELVLLASQMSEDVLNQLLDVGEE